MHTKSWRGKYCPTRSPLLYTVCIPVTLAEAILQRKILFKMIRLAAWQSTYGDCTTKSRSVSLGKTFGNSIWEWILLFFKDRIEQKRTRITNVQVTHIQVQSREKMCYLCPLNIHQSHKKNVVMTLFNIRGNHTFVNYSGQLESKKTICNLWFWHTCDPKSRSRTSNVVHHKKNCKHAKFEKLHLNSVHKKVNVNFFIVKSGNTSAIALVYVQKPKIVVHIWSNWCT